MLQYNCLTGIKICAGKQPLKSELCGLNLVSEGLFLSFTLPFSAAWKIACKECHLQDVRLLGKKNTGSLAGVRINRLSIINSTG